MLEELIGKTIVNIDDKNTPSEYPQLVIKFTDGTTLCIVEESQTGYFSASITKE